MWKEAESGAPYRSCAIITTEASGSVRPIHHRMPVILRPEVHAAWLDSSVRDIARLKQILSEGLFTQLFNHPVSRQVNSIRNNDPACIDPI